MLKSFLAFWAAARAFGFNLDKDVIYFFLKPCQYNKNQPKTDWNTLKANEFNI